MTLLIKALVKARAQIGAAKKGSVNPAFRSKYADLSAVMDAVREALQANGMEFVQTIRDNSVITVVMHESGETMELAPFPIVAVKNDAQGHGSALTYARRYSLQTALGVPAEDDDGNAASKPVAAQQPDPFTHDPVIVGKFKAAADLAALQTLWQGIPANLRARYADLKDEAKDRIAVAA